MKVFSRPPIAFDGGKYTWRIDRNEVTYFFLKKSQRSSYANGNTCCCVVWNMVLIVVDTDILILIKDGLLDSKTTNVLILKLFLYFLIKNMARDYPLIFWLSHPQRFIAGRAFNRWLLLFWWWTPLQRLNSVAIWCRPIFLKRPW